MNKQEIAKGALTLFLIIVLAWVFSAIGVMGSEYFDYIWYKLMTALTCFVLFCASVVAVLLFLCVK